jgi:hypothetical protein
MSDPYITPAGTTCNYIMYLYIFIIKLFILKSDEG